MKCSSKKKVLTCNCTGWSRQWAGHSVCLPALCRPCLIRTHARKQLFIAKNLLKLSRREGVREAGEVGSVVLDSTSATTRPGLRLSHLAQYSRATQPETSICHFSLYSLRNQRTDKLILGVRISALKPPLGFVFVAAKR